MAFVARRNVKGKLVDCQVISGLDSSSMPMSDISDEDTDSGGMLGYSHRSFMSKTVRHVASKDEGSDLDSCLTYDGSNGANGDTDLDSIVTISHRLKEDIVMCSNKRSSYMPIRIGANGDDDSYTSNYEKMQLDDLGSIDGDTICSPRRDDDKVQPDSLSLDSFDVPLECQTSVPDKMLPEDAQSLSSIGSASISPSTFGTTVIPKDGLSLDLDDCSTFSGLTDGDNSLNSQADTQSQLTSRTFNVKSTTLRRDDCSSASTYSWADMYGAAKSSESRSNIVPSLSLNFSTASSGSATCFRNLDEEKERHRQDAYQEWVKRKALQNQKKQQTAKQEREKRDADNAMRRRLANERYQDWCRQKELQQKKTITGSIKTSSSSSGPIPTKPKPIRKETGEATKKRVEEWNRVKTQQQQRERERRRQQELSQVQQEKQRKQKSAGAWQNWMKSVETRPKPVPLNKGLDTLRGTISSIYVNPVQWVSNIDPNDSRGN